MQSNELLRALSSGVRTNSPERKSSAPIAESGTFSEMLAKAAGGGVSSGSTVKIGKGVDLALSPEQLQRVSAAADVAEANGATRALILVDGQALKLDVPTRTIIGEAQGSSAAAMPDIDSVVSAAPKDGATTAPGKLIGPPGASPASLQNLSLRNAAARMQNTPAAGE